MSKEETPPAGGLLSKMVRFVRNPTVQWTELDSLQDDRESQYSKQMLKEMIERKRRNDFVRRREFDQLRKLRQREVLQGQRVDCAPGGPDGPPYGHTPIEKSIRLCALRAGRLLFVALIRFEACQRLVKLQVLTLVRLKLFCNLDPNQVGLDTIGKTMQT